MNRWTISLACCQYCSICFHYLNSHHQQDLPCLFFKYLLPRFCLSVRLSIKLELLIGKDHTSYALWIPSAHYSALKYAWCPLGAGWVVELIALMKWQVNCQTWNVCMIYWGLWGWSEKEVVKYPQTVLGVMLYSWLALRCIGQWSIDCCVSFLFHTTMSKYTTCLNCGILGLPCNDATAAWPPHVLSCSTAMGLSPVVFL